MLQQKVRKLKECIESYKSALVALSGGVDSSLVLYFTQKYLEPKNVKAVILVSPIFAVDEQKRAEELCSKYGVELIKQEINVFENAEIIKNSEERCYHCKKNNFTLLKKIASEAQLEAVFCGNNLSDDPEKRPGMKACDELDIVSPLRTSGIIKAEVHQLAQLNSISSWCFASNSCYLTRFPYNTEPTLERIRKIDEAESFVKNYIPYSRVRLRENETGDQIRIETVDSMVDAIFKNKKKIVAYLETLGYKKIYIDLNP
ncbi:hypothetical protein KAJ27_09960 [bacterium]|nr:hypothetical protein [bacterium]